jgi:hypothetical protein
VRSGAASGVVDPGSPTAGYQNFVGSVRVGAPGKSPFADVGREASTKVSVRVPTAYERATNGTVVVVGGVFVDAGGLAADGDVPDAFGIDEADGLAAGLLSLPVSRTPVAATAKTTAAATTSPIPTVPAMRRRRRVSARRRDRCDVMGQHGSERFLELPRGGSARRRPPV